MLGCFKKLLSPMQQKVCVSYLIIHLQRASDNTF